MTSPNTDTPEVAERVAAILKRNRKNRYAEEAIANDDLIDECDAREIVGVSLSEPRNVR